MMHDLAEIPPEVWILMGAVFVAFFVFGLVRQQWGNKNDE